MKPIWWAEGTCDTTWHNPGTDRREGEHMCSVEMFTFIDNIYHCLFYFKFQLIQLCSTLTLIYLLDMFGKLMDAVTVN